MKTGQFFTLLFAVLLSFGSRAQTGVKGIVKDENNRFVQATVTVFDTVSNSPKAFCVADTSGYYEIPLHPKSCFKMKVSFLGYETIIIPVCVGENNFIEKNFVLKKKEYKLENVDIVYTQPVKVNGDTTTYDADFFSGENDRKLGDILKNLPGVEVTDNGEVRVKGKKVSKIKVDDKDFFGGDSKLATENIPANVIDKIQVLENYNEVGMMKGVNAGDDNTVINIKLKEGKKRFWFGNIEAGAGFNDKYLFNPKLFYYSPETSVNFIGNINNTGKQSLSLRDYIRFSGGLSGLLSGDDGTFSLNSEELSFLFTPYDEAAESSPKFGAVNVSRNFSDKMYLSGFFIVNADDILMRKNESEYYFANSNTENVNSASDISGLFSLYNVRFNFKPDYKTYLDYGLYGKYNDNNFFNTSVSDISGETDIQKNSKINDIRQNLKLYRSVGDKGIFTLKSEHKYFNNDFDMSFYSAVNNFELTEFAETGYLNFDQHKLISGNDVRLKAEYIYLINKQSNIRAGLGGYISSSLLALNTRQITDDGIIDFSEDSQLSNIVDKDLKYYYSELKYSVLKGKLIMSASVKLNRYISENKQKSYYYSDINTIISPGIYLKYKFMKTKDISFRYSEVPKFADISELSDAYVFSGYNNAVSGNGSLKTFLYRNLSLVYMFFNNFSFSNTGWFVNYSEKINPVNRSSQITDNVYISTFEQFENPERMLSSNFNYEKRIRKIKVSVKNALTFSIYDLKINNEIADNTVFSHNYKLSFSSYFSDSPNFEAGGDITFSNFRQYDALKSKYRNLNFFANIEVPFLKRFIFIADYKYNINENTETGDKTYYSFLNTELYYKTANEKFEFSVSCKNMLNTQSIKDIQNNDYFLYTSDYIVRNRYVLFTVNFKL
ncbi:MAG: outer membrane beta-barrel protein [Chlorobi bacterium]|nr:outer membrane beta-barrel protein [Chlorobiota bacterium]